MEVFKFTSAFITNEKLAELEKGKLKGNLCLFFILKVVIEPYIIGTMNAPGKTLGDCSLYCHSLRRSPGKGCNSFYLKDGNCFMGNFDFKTPGVEKTDPTGKLQEFKMLSQHTAKYL